MFEDVQPIVAPYEDRPPVCRPYDPRTAGVARQIASLIRTHLPQVEVEHVGSTAVRGCDGEGTVDLMLPVAAADAEQAGALLERLGFQPRSPQDCYPVDRPTWLGTWPDQGDAFPVRLFLIPPDAPEADEMCFFRTCLSVDPELAKAYVARKRQILAGGQVSAHQYGLAKGEFIREVLR